MSLEKDCILTREYVKSHPSYPWSSVVHPHLFSLASIRYDKRFIEYRKRLLTEVCDRYDVSALYQWIHEEPWRRWDWDRLLSNKHPRLWSVVKRFYRKFNWTLFSNPTFTFKTFHYIYKRDGFYGVDDEEILEQVNGSIPLDFIKEFRSHASQLIRMSLDTLILLYGDTYSKRYTHPSHEWKFYFKEHAFTSYDFTRTDVPWDYKSLRENINSPDLSTFISEFF